MKLSPFAYVHVLFAFSGVRFSKPPRSRLAFGKPGVFLSLCRAEQKSKKAGPEYFGIS